MNLETRAGVGTPSDRSDDGSVLHPASGPVLELTAASNSPQELIDTNEDAMPDHLPLKFGRATVASWATGGAALVLRTEGEFEAPAGTPVGTYFSGDVVLPTRGVGHGVATAARGVRSQKGCLERRCAWQVRGQRLATSRVPRG